MNKSQIAIIGAGPAGLAAATEAISYGLSVTLFDDNPMPGGQYLKQLPDSFQRSSKHPIFDQDISRHYSLLKVIGNPKLNYLKNTSVWGLFSDRQIAYSYNGKTGSIKADSIIVASGAFDRPVPFPGWTLPGVLTAGGVQNLIKSQRIAPGGQVLVAGNGPLILLVARNLHRAGAKVLGVAEASRNRMTARTLLGLFSAPGLLAKGLGIYADLRKARIQVMKETTVLEVKIANSQNTIELGRINQSGKIDRTRLRSIKADSLVVGFGMLSSSEATKLAGCKHYYKISEGGWIPYRSADFETSIPGIFAVGDCAGIKGADIAFIEGRIAGLTAAVRLGQFSGKTSVERIRNLKKKLNKLTLFRKSIAEIYAAPDNFLSLITPDTIVCRCDNVRAAEVFGRIDLGFKEVNTVKVLTRAGMGRCQGRNCLATLAEIMMHEAGSEFSESGFPRVRPPIKPIRIKDLLTQTSVGT